MIGGTAGEHKRAGARNRTVVQFVSIYLGALLAFQVFYYQLLVPSAAFAAYMDFIARAAAFVLRVAGEDVASNAGLMVGGFSMFVRPGCDGLQVLAILVIGILVYPGSPRRKLLGLLLGVPAVFLLNVLRLASLHWAGAHWPEPVFQALHIHVWPAFLIFFVLAFWTVWALGSNRDTAAS